MSKDLNPLMHAPYDNAFEFEIRRLIFQFLIAILCSSVICEQMELFVLRLCGAKPDSGGVLVDVRDAFVERGSLSSATVQLLFAGRWAYVFEDFLRKHVRPSACNKTCLSPLTNLCSIEKGQKRDIEDIWFCHSTR